MQPDNAREWSGLSLVQLALNTSDMAGTLQLYSEVFGFANAGSNAIWGEKMKIQGLDASARALIWWLVGRQRFFQLELFRHTVPEPKPQPQDWMPSDHGWVRFGIAVTSFDRTIALLERWGIQLLTTPVTVAGLRRVAFRDPFAGVIVEVLEDGAALPGGVRPKGRDLDPALVYVTSSVADIDSALHFYKDVLGFRTHPQNVLHDSAHEELWGLRGARPAAFLAEVGDVFIEVVYYDSGRPKPPGHRVIDQGIMNIALASRDVKVARNAIENAQREGVANTGIMAPAEDRISTYFVSPGREIELWGLPTRMDAQRGFEPGVPFIAST